MSTGMKCSWALVAALLLAPAVLGSQALGLLSQMGIAVILCLSFWLLMGQGGMVSFGHALYSGLGAFVAIYGLRAIEAGAAWPATLVPLVAALVVAALAWPLGWLATRHDSTMVFAMITLGLGEMAWAIAQMLPGLFGGEAGIAADRTAGSARGGLSLGPAWQVYLLVLAYTFATLALVRGLTRTALGRLLNAVRDNPSRVSFMGHDPRRVRHVGFVVAAFFAGLAGALAALFNEIVSTEVLSSHRSAMVLVFTIIGGLGSMAGGVIGGVLMVLATVVMSSWTPAWLLYMGLAFVLVLLLMPGGIAGGWRAMVRAALERPLGALALALGVLSAGALLEMAYQLRLASTLGPEVIFLGLRLDAHAMGHWCAGLALLALGFAGWRLAQRRPARTRP
jgi:branched-chain amino acid transport system permease protein